uniref:Uncharacterized protein n=1 Tax=Tanacetum cinerariifolium TaxID=118510 RepID=A0A699JFI5_TANCI|nr:hypothetical protein [Tanacetum cinerariifolium]
MRQKNKSGSCTKMYRSHWLSQLIELNVNGFHDSSGSFVVDSITFPAWCITHEYSNISFWLLFFKIFVVIGRITKSTKDSEKGKIRLLIMHHLIWGLVVTSVNLGSVLGVTSSSHSFCLQKHQSLGKYQHRPSSLDESTVLSFDNAVLLWSHGKCLLVENADTFKIFNQSSIDEFCAIIDQDSLNSAAGGNFLDKMPCECLAIIESKSKVSMNTSTSGISLDVVELKDMVKALILNKKSQSQSPAPMKAVEESCLTYGGAHSYHNYPATDGNVYRDNIQEFVS